MQTNDKEILFVEKYRPQSIKDCVLPEHTKATFQGYVDSGTLPHIILSGSPGSGKTTAAKALCNDLGYNWIILNSSNERGIDVLRTTVTQFASSASIDGARKCVIFDEFDYSTPLLQAAMREAMESFSKTCSFIFTCNYPQRIMDAIHSRATVIDYTIRNEEKPKMAKTFFDRLTKILDNEGIEYDKKAVVEIVQKFFPDFRRVLNECQRFAAATGKINMDILQTLKAGNIDEYIKHVKAKDFKEARKWIVENLSGKDANDLFRQVYDTMNQNIDPQSIPQLVLTIAEYQYKGMNCPDPEINFAAFTIMLMSEISFK
jgi:DNA polymerase III delta prime subunit